MQALRPDTPIQYIQGVGPRKATFFAAAGMHVVADVLEYFPSRYEVLQRGVDIADLQPQVSATVIGDVVRVQQKEPMLLVQIHDGTEMLRLRWFNPPRAAGMLRNGARVVASGRTQVYNERLEMLQPEISVYPPGGAMPIVAPDAKLAGIYPTVRELKSPLIRRTIERILEQPELAVAEVVPAGLLARRNLLSRNAALRAMHQPQDEAQHVLARRSLAYEELLLLELAMAMRRRRILDRESGQKLLCTPEIDRRIRARFPFTLTAAQNGALRDIVADLRSGRPMTRLVQGDVGCGKTVIALYACLLAIANRKQAAIMAPTEILAQQHFANIERYLAGSRVRRALLRGGGRRAERAETLAAIERGQIDLVVGTQALIQKDVYFHDLALVIVDEQHKFGVLQRHDFRGKGGRPHYLVMTATPIPRTLAMSVFGDLDVSVVKSSPPGRGKIVTRVTTPAKWPDVMAYVRKRIEAGEQAYVVCPQIGEVESANDVSSTTEPAANVDAEGAAGNDASQKERATRKATAENSGARGRGDTPIRSATEVWQELSRGPWAGLNVGLLHGGLRSVDARKVIDAFAAGELHALVSTTIVEVGIDVSRATMMIIEHAERFGLSQLHQLRGRVGRGARDSLCVLINRSHRRRLTEQSLADQRLAVMAATTDGFRIAEADMKLRGPGQLFGTRQHGLPELRVASVVDDFELLEMAREDAFALVRDDPRLEHEAHRTLWPALRKMFAGKLSLIDAA